MLDFICMGSADLFGTWSKRKIQNKNMCLHRQSNVRHETPRQVSLCHDALMVISGLMSYRIMDTK